MRTPLLKHCHIVKLGRLMDMLYKPSELAEEIGINVDTIYRSYMPAGLPYTTDPKGNYWIHGPAFVAWARETIALKRSKRKGLEPGQAWCMKCSAPVEMIGAHIVYQNRYLQIQQGDCPHCKRKVNRAAKSQYHPIVEPLKAEG